jgi:hypothetical protein
MTLWPQSELSLGTKMRAKLSAPPPGVNGTTMVTGLLGNVCALANWQSDIVPPRTKIPIVLRKLRVLDEPM